MNIPEGYDPEVAYLIENLYEGDEGHIDCCHYYMEIYCRRGNRNEM